MACAATPSPGTGQGFAWRPSPRAFQHRASAFDVLVARRAVSFTTVVVQRASVLVAGAGTVVRAVTSLAAARPMHSTQVATSSASEIRLLQSPRSRFGQNPAP